jgi:hypothetical protein
MGMGMGCGDGGGGDGIVWGRAEKDEEQEEKETKSEREGEREREKNIKKEIIHCVSPTRDLMTMKKNHIFLQWLVHNVDDPQHVCPSKEGMHRKIKMHGLSQLPVIAVAAVICVFLSLLFCFVC